VSKAFTKDDDSAAEPVVIPPRAPLPEGVPNYVTARGHKLLRAEHQQLEEERATAEQLQDEAARRRALAALSARLGALDTRLRSAILVDNSAQPRDEVRFGAAVTVRTEVGTVRTYEIVGVDEARGAEGRIAFIAPLARALLGRRPGDTATVKTPRGEEDLEILSITYARP
jgi:transcription elongation factor GreB